MQEDLLRPGDPQFRQFYKIFEHFKLEEEKEGPQVAPPKTTPIEETPMTIAAKLAAAQKKQREEDSDDEVMEGNYWNVRTYTYVSIIIHTYQRVKVISH